MGYLLPVKKVTIFEVGPRDGLQNEPKFISTENKIKLTNMLGEAGCRRIEVTSFVHPKWVPQMADAEEVLNSIKRYPGVVYNALVPNLKGLDRALKAGLEEIVTIMSVSESHNKKNLNMTVAESLKELEIVNKTAASAHVRVRSYIATAYGCPMDGYIAPERVSEIALTLESYGSYEISLGDTTGMASPRSAYEVGALVKKNLKTASLAAHFHRADGIEFANVLASLEAGIDIIDSAAGGLGGCPYAPGAKGNIATEVLVEMLHRLGIETGIDGEAIDRAGAFAKSLSSYYCEKESDHENLGTN
ncbi:MAG: hydroxymethylglutaryl-CoA lyase [Treponemataceae bacterium]